MKQILDSGEEFLFRFSCRNQEDKHEFVCTRVQVRDTCRCGYKIDFERRQNWKKIFPNQVEKVSLRLDIPYELTYTLLIDTAQDMFERKSMRIHFASTLSYFLEDNSVENIKRFLAFTRTKFYEDTQSFWEWYFNFHKSKLSNIRTASATPLRSSFYKYTLSMFKDDLDQNPSIVQISGKTSEGKQQALHNLYTSGQRSFVDKTVWKFATEGEKALGIKAELRQQKYKESDRIISRMAQNTGVIPEIQETVFVRQAGKGGINRWKRY